MWVYAYARFLVSCSDALEREFGKFPGGGELERQWAMFHEVVVLASQRDGWRYASLSSRWVNENISATETDERLRELCRSVGDAKRQRWEVYATRFPARTGFPYTALRCQN